MQQSLRERVLQLCCEGNAWPLSDLSSVLLLPPPPQQHAGAALRCTVISAERRANLPRGRVFSLLWTAVKSLTLGKSAT
jgi:hypothetical protein